MDPTELVKKYEREIRELKQELQMHDSLVGRSQIVYDEFTPEQKYEIQQKVKQYIDAPEDEEDNVFELVNIRQIKEIFKQVITSLFCFGYLSYFFLSNFFSICISV